MNPKELENCSVNWFPEQLKWLGLVTFGIVESTQRYQEVCRSCPRPRGVENGLHWCLDIPFREDDGRVRQGNVAENLAILPIALKQQFTTISGYLLGETLRIF